MLWVEQLEQVQYLQLNHKGTKDIQPCDIQYLQHIWGFSQAPDNSCGAFFGASEPSLTLWEWTIGMEKEGDDIASGNRQTGSLLYSVEQQNTTPNLTRVETAARDVKSPSTPPPMGSHLQSSGSASSRHGRPAEVTQYSPDAPKSVSSGVASQKAGESSSNLSKNSVLQSIWSPTENEHATFASAFSSGGISNDTMCRAVAGAMQNSNATAGKWIPDRCVPQLGHNLAPYGHRPCNWPPEGMLSNSTECFQNPQPTTEYVSSMLSKLSLKQVCV